MKLPYNVEQKLRKFSISNLMNYIVAAQAIVFVFAMALPQYGIIGRLELVWSRVMAGEIWRLITFVIIPRDTSFLIILFLYFYWMVGTQLENRWGTVKFNLYYWIGILGAIISAIITGYATNEFLNLSLFFAFAILYPDVQFNLFFLIPIKAKYIAILDALYYGIMLVTGSWSTRAMVIFSLINLILFLGGDLINHIRRDSKYWKTRWNFRKNMR